MLNSKIKTVFKIETSVKLFPGKFYSSFEPVTNLDTVFFYGGLQ